MRVRFAPSPTGSLHLGNARTALLNYLAARGNEGTLVLRIEDTDVERNVAGAEAAILGDLRWMNLDWAEGPEVGGEYGPYVQSERAALYRAAAARLVRDGRAYHCWCQRDELARARTAAMASGRDARYPGTCRHLDATEIERHRAAGDTSVVRLRVPERDVHFDDGLRGETGVAAGQIDDFVIVRGDGRPTYQFAVVVDDHAMGITDVIRGQDHLSNTPRQALLFEALGWLSPRFTHLPLVLGADRSRLSKRHGATSVAAMREQGILPEALVNYLALLGWAPPEGQEVLSLQQLVQHWRLEAMSSSNVVFDVDKLVWLNQQHLLQMTPEEVLRRAVPFLGRSGFEVPTEGLERDWWVEVIDLVRPATSRLTEVGERAAVFFADGAAPDQLSTELQEPGVRQALEAFAAASAAGEMQSVGAFRATAKKISVGAGVRGRSLFHPLRVALSGDDHGPELARLVPLLERGAELDLRPEVAGVGDRVRRALAARE